MILFRLPVAAFYEICQPEVTLIGAVRVRVCECVCASVCVRECRTVKNISITTIISINIKSCLQNKKR